MSPPLKKLLIYWCVILNLSLMYMKEKDGKGNNLIISLRKSFDLFQSHFALVLLCLPYEHNMPDLIKSIRASLSFLFKDY